MAAPWLDFPAPAPLLILLLGRPGSGKGTQGAALSETLEIPHISTGDLLRSEIDRHSPVGVAVERSVSDGRLVSDELVFEALCARLCRADVRERGFVLDGYPRSVAQAAALERAIAPARIDASIELLIGEREAAHRLHARFVCDGCGHSPVRAVAPQGSASPDRCPRCRGVLRRRADDEVLAVRRRFDEYERLTKPLLEWLDRRRMLVTVDADRPAAEITMMLVDELQRGRGRAALATSA
jgi:adenylate kinase